MREYGLCMRGPCSELQPQVDGPITIHPRMVCLTELLCCQRSAATHFSSWSDTSCIVTEYSIKIRDEHEHTALHCRTWTPASAS